VPGPAEAERRTRVLRQEYERLAENERLSIGLHDIEGLMLAASAEIAGKSVGSLRRRRERGLAVLRHRMQKRGISPCDVDTTLAPIWYGRTDTAYDDDFTASMTAILPDGPVPLCSAAEEDVSEQAG